jgi:hypothetical protein
VIQLTELTAPENWQYCYNATAYVYFKTDIKPLVSKIQQRDSVQRVARNLNPKEATLYLYREKSPIGEPIKYTVQAGDAEYIAKNASKKAIKLTKEGKLIVKANDKLITLDVKMGEAYYLKCGLRPSTLAALGGGVLINVFPTVPTLKIMPFEEGETEYKKLQTQ